VDVPTASSPGVAAPPPPSRWLVVQEIGRGGHGVVYHALDTLVGREVALKTSADRNHERGSARLRHEAQLLGRVSDPNVVTLYDLVHRADGVALAMELVDGPSLDSLVPQRLTAAEIIALGRQLASGVQGLHRAGIVHGDIKPSNLRLSSNGVLKILDLGIARDAGEARQSPDLGRPMSSGTRAYMAPELRAGNAPSVLSDVWSVGTVLFELATGTRWCDEPRSNEDSRSARRLTTRLGQRLGCQLDESSRHRRRIDVPALAEIIERALATSANARFESAKALGDALARIVPVSAPRSATDCPRGDRPRITRNAAPPSKWRRRASVPLSADATAP